MRVGRRRAGGFGEGGGGDDGCGRWVGERELISTVV